jgi:hypothetical protein
MLTAYRRNVEILADGPKRRRDSVTPAAAEGLGQPM